MSKHHWHPRFRLVTQTLNSYTPRELGPTNQTSIFIGYQNVLRQMELQSRRIFKSFFWSRFFDKLPDSNFNKIPTDLRGIILQPDLYGRYLYLWKIVSDTVIRSKSVTDAIVSAIYKSDSLTIVSETYNDFMSLLNTKRGHAQSFKRYESRFEAKASKFGAHSSQCILPEFLTAFATCKFWSR